ncbi:MAG: hypothetical protein OXF41_21615 [bacterium]|nr:hypothetical protein [bacterium]
MLVVLDLPAGGGESRDYADTRAVLRLDLIEPRIAKVEGLSGARIAITWAGYMRGGVGI